MCKKRLVAAFKKQRNEEETWTNLNGGAEGGRAAGPGKVSTGGKNLCRKGGGETTEDLSRGGER